MWAARRGTMAPEKFNPEPVHALLSELLVISKVTLRLLEDNI